MAKSVKRGALKDAWIEWNDGEDDGSPINYQFEAGFDAAWDALLAEIGPLVNDLKPMHLMDFKEHIHAVERLRELVREGDG